MSQEKLSIRRTDSFLEQLAEMENRIMRRAHEIFMGNGGGFGKELDNWRSAERELIWKPSIEMREEDGEFKLEIAVPGIESKDLDIEVTPEDLLVKGEIRHEHREDKGKVHVCEFQSGTLFRSIHFPKKIEPEKVAAEFKNGLLKIKAPIAEAARKVKVEAA
jgi:HSP20 family molecular chaperone IbpA